MAVLEHVCLLNLYVTESKMICRGNKVPCELCVSLLMSSSMLEELKREIKEGPCVPSSKRKPEFGFE